MSRERRKSSGPTASELSRFDQVSQSFDPNTPEQFQAWTQAANTLSNRGWGPEQVISRLWSLRPEFKTEGLSPKDAANILVKEQEASAKAQRSRRSASLPSNEELFLQRSMVQTAALEGEQVVVRNWHPGDGLPTHVIPATPYLPFHVDPVTHAALTFRDLKDKI